MRVKTELAVVVPFDMQSQVVETEIPVSYLLVVGDVPMYYYDSKGNPVGESQANAPNIALPSLPGTEEKLERQLPDGMNSEPGNGAAPEADPGEPDAEREPAENAGQNAGEHASSP
ncbi:hypothetical protein HMSSN036_43530 [Paenibacillus macerans]|nr:hypothetical protein HMSSN036_43530 [Paenibacillus macerans]